MSHTLGPLAADSVFIDNSPNRIIIHEDKWGGETVADCGEDNERNRANAYLLVTAPEMLAWLRGIVNQADAQYKAGDDVCTLGRGVIDSIRNTIAKAIAIRYCPEEKNNDSDD